MTTAFDPYTNTVLIDDGEDYVRSVKLTPKEVSASKLISRPQGTLWVCWFHVSSFFFFSRC